MQEIRFEQRDPEELDAIELIDALSETLARITGDSGRSSFAPQDVRGERACFVMAYDESGLAVACGAIRPINEEIAELKRMFVRPTALGAGGQLLANLEQQALRLGFTAIYLETRRVNQKAVQFYQKHGYRVIPNYGSYVGKAEAVCFEKRFELGLETLVGD